MITERQTAAADAFLAWLDGYFWILFYYLSDKRLSYSFSIQTKVFHKRFNRIL